MIHTDGRPTIANRHDSCPVLTAPGTVTEIRLRPGADCKTISKVRQRHPRARIVIPPEEEAA